MLAAQDRESISSLLPVLSGAFCLEISMSTCAKCPAYFPTHTPEGEERRGVCRLEPPRVYRRFVKFRDPVNGQDQEGQVYDSAWPPVMDSHWCVKGRVLMEQTAQIPKTFLTEPPENPREHPAEWHRRALNGG